MGYYGILYLWVITVANLHNLVNGESKEKGGIDYYQLYAHVSGGSSLKLQLSTVSHPHRYVKETNTHYFQMEYLIIIIYVLCYVQLSYQLFLVPIEWINYNKLHNSSVSNYSNQEGFYKNKEDESLSWCTWPTTEKLEVDA
jgi:hypothetical protein